MTERLHFHFSLSCIGEGNGNPLQCSCLETPRDGGAWWAAVYGVPQSRTRLKRLSSSSSSSRSPLPPGSLASSLHTVDIGRIVTTMIFSAPGQWLPSCWNQVAGQSQTPRRNIRNHLEKGKLRSRRVIGLPRAQQRIEARLLTHFQPLPHLTVLSP